MVVDFNGRLKALEKAARAYRDLSAAGDAKVAANALFDTLRWAEGVPGAANVIADLSEERASSALIAGVADRVYRAASARSRSPGQRGVAVKQGKKSPSANQSGDSRVRLCRDPQGPRL